MRDSYEVGEISVMQWISGRLNLADDLTKRNLEIYRMLKKVATSGLLDPTISQDGKRVKFTS